MTKKKNKTQEPYFVYIFFLTSLAIFVSVLRGIKFDIDMYSISLTVFIYPMVFYILNGITRKYGYNKALESIFISSAIMILFMVITGFIFNKDIDALTYLGLFASYLVSCFLNLVIYYFLYMNTTVPKITLFTNYLFVIMVNEIIYLLLSFNNVLANDFWMVYMLEVGIQSILAFIFTIYEQDKKLYSK